MANVIKAAVVAMAMTVSTGAAIANEPVGGVQGVEMASEQSMQTGSDNGGTGVQAYCWYETYCNIYGYCWTSWVCF